MDMRRRTLVAGLTLALLTADTLAVEPPTFAFEHASDVTLSNPHDVKLSADGRHLYVSDVGSGRVVVLDADTLQLRSSFGAGQLSGTHDIDFDPAGRAYVADTHNGRVAIFELQQDRAMLVGELRGPIAGPEGVLVHPNGMIYVAGAWSHNVVAFRDGEPVHSLHGLSAPHDLELAANGDLWLADAGNDRILRLSPTLQIVAELSGPAYAFDGVRYLDVLPDGALLAADKNSHTVKLIGRDGKLLARLGNGRAGRGPNVFTTPEGVDSSGDRVWISDSGNDRVVRYRVRR